MNHKEYFKLLKINSKFISICDCPRRYYHQYCASANVFRTKRIFCSNCFCYYHLHVKREKLISTKNLKQIFKLFLIYIFFQALVIGFMSLDGYLKEKYDTGVDTESKSISGHSAGIELSIALILIWVWCLSLQLRKYMNKNERILHVEVLDPSKDDIGISRFQAKKNLKAALTYANEQPDKPNTFD
mmetsp:Transcript_39658/g.60742  ORF Transcript_39658/g.60742 Transcript_39658/m.60742 type:complete len:186 (-) Transcript_39658:157-714(-)